jgi:putative protease
MGRHDVDLLRIHIGDRIWRTNDPALDKALRATYETDKPYRTFPVVVHAHGRAGAPLVSVWTDVSTGNSITVASEALLAVALKRPMDETLLREQFGRLGGTLFTLSELELQLTGPVIVPMSELNRMRRDAVEQLEAQRRRPPAYVKRSVDVYADATPRHAPGAVRNRVTDFAADRAVTPRLTALCRNLAQVQAVAQHTDVELIYADFEFIKQFPAAVEAVRAAGKRIALVTPRIHMPGEAGYFNNILRLQPDVVLVRNTGAVYWFTRHRRLHPDAQHPILIGDFSLNIANHKTAQLFLDAGLSKLIPSYDLNIQQMLDLLRHTDASKLEVVIHQHLPMFHTEHCVYCTFLSEGTDYTNCGRPCEAHRVSLRDRIGMSHPVRVDEGCRNTVYNAVEQSGAEYLDHFVELGVQSFRVEFLEETPDQVMHVLGLYNKALRGEVSGTHVWRTLKATNQLGVTRGQLVK